MRQECKIKKIAVMGGTFDPIHFGHLSAAQFAAEEFNIDEVLFIPAGIPYFKDQSKVSPAKERLIMTKIAVKDNLNFSVSDMEIKRNSETYTVDTMEELSLKFKGKAKLYLITGSDAVSEIEKWHEAEKLLRFCDIIAVSRPGSDGKWEEFKSSEFFKRNEAKFLRLQIPGVDVSSTELRKRISEGKSVRYLMPDEVIKYIESKGLYKNKEEDFDFEKAKIKLMSAVSPKRFKHIMGVVKEAERLSDIWNGDRKKVRVAALLHDCAKGIPQDISLSLCRQYGVNLDEDTLKSPKVIHQFLGEALAKAEYGVSDKEILNAIKYHTTGRENMSITEKIVFCADYTEENRKIHEDLKMARILVDEDLDKAVHFILQSTVDFVKKNNSFLHSLSEKALRYYEKY